MKNPTKLLLSPFIFVVLGIGFFVPNFATADHTTTHTIEQLQARIEQLQAQIRVLQQQTTSTNSVNPANSQPEPQPSSVPLVCPEFSRTLYRGVSDANTGGEVTKLQKVLTADPTVYPEGLVTGYYGSLTEKAVQRWQAKQGIVSSGSATVNGYGVVGPQTRARMIVACPTLPPLPVNAGYLQIEPSSASVAIGESKSFQAFYQPPMLKCPEGFACPQVMPARYPVVAEWTSSNPDIASIDIIGSCAAIGCPTPTNVLIKGVSSGTAEIKASYKSPYGGGGTDGREIMYLTTVTATAKVTVGSVSSVPSITSIQPIYGPVGTQVTLTVSGLTQTPSPLPGSGVSVLLNTIIFGSARINNIASSDGRTLTFNVPFGYGCEGSTYPYPCDPVPVNPGTYNISVSNANGTSNSVSFTVTRGTTQSSIQVLSPNGGETWIKGTTQTIKWQDNTPIVISTCPVGSYCPVERARTYDIKLVPYYPPCTGNICPRYVILGPYTIANGVYGSSYSWLVGKILDTYGIGDSAPGSSYTIQVCQTGSKTCDSSDSFFKIVSGGTSANNSPVINSIPAIPVSINVGQSVLFSWGATDADGDNLAWGVSWADGIEVAGACQSPNPQNRQGWTYNTSHAWSNPGTYTVKATANDCRGGNDEHSFTVSVQTN